jgi:hypothetical protein
MSAYSENYDVEESMFEDFSSDELSLPAFLRPGKKISVPGAGLVSATLNTPKGPAKLNLPAAVPTQTQFRQLESAVNAQTQRINAVQAELARVRRELAVRRREQAGFGSTSMLMPLLMQKKLREDLEGHTHVGNSAAPVMPASSGSSLSSMLPLLLMMPGMFGGSSSAGGSNTTASGSESADAMSPLMMMILLDAL